MTKVDVIVVGAGILGIAHAYHCLKAGLKVALIERNKLPQDATVRNFGQIVPSGMDRKWQAYGRESTAIYKTIQAEVDISARQQGTVYLAHDQEELGLLEELHAINKEENYESILLNKNACLEQYPGLNSSYVKAGLYFPQEINLDPRFAASRIIHFLQNRYGLSFYPNTTIHTIESQSEGVLALDSMGEQFRSELLFICSGTEFQLLYRDLFSQSDIDLVKLQMLETYPLSKQRIPGSILTHWSIRRYESFKECPSFSDIKAKENPNSFHREFGIHILFKQSADGSVIIGDSHEYAPVKNQNSLGFDMNNEINKFMLTQAQRIFDLEDWRISRLWNGYYSQCRDQEIFNHSIDNKIHIITGIGGKGMTGSFGYARENVSQILSINLEKLSIS